MKKLLFLISSVFAASVAMASDAQVVYVDCGAQAGGDGSKIKPFATPYEAITGVRAMRKAGKLLADKPLEVRFASGDYVLGKPLEFTSEDSGTAASPVIWTSEESRGARFIGGVKLNASMFTELKDEKLLARLPEEARGKVLVADLSSVVKGEFPEMTPHFGNAPTRPALFVDHKPMTLARWPNTGWTGFKKAVDTGYVKDASGVEERNKRHPGSFEYNNERANRWNFEEGVWLNGYLTHDWHNESVKIAGLEKTPTNSVIKLACATAFGVKAGATWGNSERRFYVFNLFDELDVPGEYYLNRKTKQLYLIPPADGEFAKMEMVLATNGAPFVMKKGNPKLENFSLEGLSFEYSAVDGIQLSGVNNVTVDNCFLGNINGCGLQISGMSNRVANCELHGMGRSGISVGGGDRKKLVKSESVAEGNVVHDFGRYQRTYAGAINASGCGITIRRNKMYDSPHTAVFWGGNEILIEYNEVFNVLLETGDAGAYYSGRDWTTCGNILRYNFTHHCGDVADNKGHTMGFYFDDCDCGDEVYGNIFWRIPRGIMIGGGRQHPVRNNIFAECVIGLSMDFRGVTWKQWNLPGGSWHLEGKANALKYKEEPWASKYPWLANIMNEAPREPLDNPLENNIFLNCRNKIFECDDNRVTNMFRKAVCEGNFVINTVFTNGQKQAYFPRNLKTGFRIENGTTDAPFDPGFVDWQNGDFRIKKGGWLDKNMPNFKPLENMPVMTKRKDK